jgi:DHA1 family multidrug resistance protein-like MFS transporter
MLGFYFLAMQPTITVPLLAARLVGAEAIGPLFAIQAGVAMVVQVPLVRWAAARMSPLMQVGLAMLLMGCGFVAYAIADDFLLLAVGTGVLALGMVLVIPVHSTVTARLGGNEGGAYFGVGALALAFGGAFGNGSGGLLFDVGERSGLAWLPWVGMFCVAMLSAAGFGWLNLDRRFRSRLAGGMRPAVKPGSHASPPEPSHAPGRAGADACDEADAHLDLPRSTGDLRRPGRPA